MPQGFTTTGNTKDGYTVGAGLEYMFAPNWSAKAEYQYYNFGNTTITTGPAPVVGARFRDDEHAVKVGVNYRFGWGGPAGLPVLRRSIAVSRLKKRPARAGLFACLRGSLRANACVPATKKFARPTKLSRAMRYYVRCRGWRITNMRAFALGLILSAVSVPCFAQTVLKSEPLALAPYEVAFVQEFLLRRRQGAQGHRGDPRPAPQEVVRVARFGSGLAGERDAVRGLEDELTGKPAVR